MTADGDRDREPPQDEEPAAERPELDVEGAFAAIVAGWGTPVAPGANSWPALEDVDPEEDRRRTAREARERLDGPESGPGRRTGSTRAPGPAPARDPRSGGTGSPPSGPGGSGAGAAAGPRDSVAPEPDGDEEGYVPPEPPPLPRGDLVSRLAWGGVLGGPALLLLAALFWRDVPTAVQAAALAAFVGGFVTLVARLPGRSPDDPDDGAVV